MPDQADATRVTPGFSGPYRAGRSSGCSPSRLYQCCAGSSPGELMMGSATSYWVISSHPQRRGDLVQLLLDLRGDLIPLHLLGDEVVLILR